MGIETVAKFAVRHSKPIMATLGVCFVVGLITGLYIKRKQSKTYKHTNSYTSD